MATFIDPAGFFDSGEPDDQIPRKVRRALKGSLGFVPSNPGASFEAFKGQKNLPDFLRTSMGRYGEGGPTPFGQALGTGATNLADLFRNPGGISPNLSSAIAPLMALRSQQIARDTQGASQQAAGGLARSGLGGSGMAQALEAAIQRAGQRDIADARSQATVQSEQLRRDDIGTFLDTVNMLMSVANKKNRKPSQTAANKEAGTQRTAATLATVASLAAAFSDERLKVNLRPYVWEWDQGVSGLGLTPGETQAGLLAQDIEAVWPDAIVERAGYKAVNYQLVATRLASMLAEAA